MPLESHDDPALVENLTSRNDVAEITSSSNSRMYRLYALDWNAVKSIVDDALAVCDSNRSTFPPPPPPLAAIVRSTSSSDESSETVIEIPLPSMTFSRRRKYVEPVEFFRTPTRA